MVDDTNNHDKADHASARSGKAAARPGAADRAAAMGSMALDAEAGRQVAEAAISGDAAASARQHQRSRARGADYAAALAAVQAGHADGITYMLTETRSVCRHRPRPLPRPGTHQYRHLGAELSCDVGRHTYAEVTPSGDGLSASGAWRTASNLNRKFTLEIDGKPIAAELFRRTNKALTDHRLHARSGIHELTNIDRVIDWAVVWGERRKAAAAAAAEQAASASGNGFNGSGNGCGYSIERIERDVRERRAGRRESQRPLSHDRRPSTRAAAGDAEQDPGAPAAVSRRYWRPLPGRGAG